MFGRALLCLWEPWKGEEELISRFSAVHATRVRLELFDHPEDAAPARAIDLDSARNRTGDVWHVWVKGIGPGQLYAYRVDGPYDPSEGHRFNFNRLLLDPFATAISHLPPWDFASARGYDPSAPEQDLVFSKLDNSSSMPKCVFVNEPFDWHGDRPPRHPWSKTVIYETHVRGFTIHPKSGVEHPGTYRGLMEKIPYLKTLGVTAVELMPVQEFNETSVTRKNPQTGQTLRNYWGYDPVAFFAPKASYSSSGGLGQQKLEFKEMVRAFHKAGIEVILDVVFNHTAEGNELGPTLCFRGMDNAIFYTLAATNATTRTIPEPATPSTPTIPWCGTTSWPRSVIGWWRCMWMDSGLTWRRFWAGAVLATCCPIPRCLSGSPRTRS